MNDECSTSRSTNPIERSIMDDTERQNGLLKLWFQRLRRNRTRRDLHTFYGELVLKHMELLVTDGRDPYEQLKADLRGHIVER
jgi:hypothetical protein